MQSDKLKSYLHLHLIVFIWGFTAVLGKLISLDALPLVWFRMLFAVGFIYIFIRLKKLPIQISKKDSIRLLIAGLIIALHWFTFFKAIKVSNISITLACLSTGAFFTSLIEPIFFRKKIIWTDIFFGIIVIIGLYFIAKSINTDQLGLLHSIVYGGNKYL
ncbi:MAG: EamA family transporter, partial [Flavobacterium sp.]|nr:EamA family transporter [Flavobacterium sp.]